MTMPGGQISLGDANNEMGRGGETSLWFLNDNLKPAYRNRYDLNGYKNFAWYQKNNEANCSNGNCYNCNCNCGNVNCNNCFNCYAYNCLNCDGRAWLQPNCNCMGNCVAGTGLPFQCNNCVAVSYDCNCNCSDCNCG